MTTVRPCRAVQAPIGALHGCTVTGAAVQHGKNHRVARLHGNALDASRMQTKKRGWRLTSIRFLRARVGGLVRSVLLSLGSSSPRVHRGGRETSVSRRSPQGGTRDYESSPCALTADGAGGWRWGFAGVVPQLG